MAQRTRPPFRADHVGSLLRPDRLHSARAQFKAGQIDHDALREVEDDAVREVIQLQHDAGLQTVTDGEQRRTSWHMDFIYSLGGVTQVAGESLHVQFHNEEGTYDYANAFGGIPTPPALAGGAKTSTKISIHNLNVRGVLGLDFKKASGMMLLGRAGIRYHSFQVANASSIEKNTAKLPSEIITSPTIGVALAMPRLTKSIGLRFSLDFIPLNISYSQTKNLADGKSPSAKGAIVGVGLTYRWKPSLDIQATYDLTYSKASFGDPDPTSMRGHPAMGSVSRTDLFHALTAGIVKSF